MCLMIRIRVIIILIMIINIGVASHAGDGRALRGQLSEAQSGKWAQGKTMYVVYFSRLDQLSKGKFMYFEPALSLASLVNASHKCRCHPPTHVV